jgi:hypothetical protein
MESTRPRGKSFLEESPLPLCNTSSSNLQDEAADDGPVMYDPSLVFDDDDDEDSNNLLDDDNNGRVVGNSDGSNGNSEEDDEDAYFSRGRSRSRSIHCNDDVTDDGKIKGLSDEELVAQIEQSAKNNEKDSNKPVVVRTGALKQREVQALQMVK